MLLVRSVEENKLNDFVTKKSIHINLTKSTHTMLRMELLKRGLSMQETFDHIASLICEKDPEIFDKIFWYRVQRVLSD